jgi:hypothetical protein
MRTITLLCILAGFGCGKDNPVIPTNSSGFPDVAGSYSFVTKTFSASCSDGSGDTSPAVSFNMGVTQNVNELSLINTSSSGVRPGITILESTGWGGLIQKNRSFNANQTATARQSGISGILNVSWNMSGTFTNNSWSGNYTVKISSVSFGESCTYSTTFSGTKIGTAKIVADTEEPLIVGDFHRHNPGK